MSFQVSIYDNVLVDMVAGAFTAATTINALLLKSAYVFDNSHVDTTISQITTNELSGGSYARFTSTAHFAVNRLNDEIQYTGPTPQVAFAAFTATDWRYIILFNPTSHALYLCVDTGVTNNQVASPVVLDPGTDPFIRVLAP